MSYIYFIGIDISKNDFTVAFYDASTSKQKCVTFPNNNNGFHDFLQTLPAKKNNCFITLEATGGYEISLLLFPCQHHYTVHRVPTLTASHYARSLSHVAKTDKLDAHALGAAPHPRESGKYTGYRSTRGGRKKVRQTLFMATMCARRFNPRIREFYESLVNKGKKRMLALVAAMRKLITILNAKLRDHLNANLLKNNLQTCDMSLSLASYNDVASCLKSSLYTTTTNTILLIL